MLCLLPQLHFVDVRSYQCDLVIFDLRCILCHNQLAAVYTGAVEFNLHIAAADDLTFKCRCECNRNVDVCDLDLDISGFQRSCVEFGNVRLNDQALWNFESIFVCDNWKPSAIAPAPQATITGSSGANAFTNAGTRSMVYFIRPAASPG